MSDVHPRPECAARNVYDAVGLLCCNIGDHLCALDGVIPVRTQILPVRPDSWRREGMMLLLDHDNVYTGIIMIQCIC